MSRNYGITDITRRKFKTFEMPKEWEEHLGEGLPDNFRMLIKGKPKNGKTEYLIRLTKMLALCVGKVKFNSAEQGMTRSLQTAVVRNKLDELPSGKWMLCDKSQKQFPVWFKGLEKRDSGRIIVLDSIDYMNLTTDEYKQLNDKFPHKILILVGWNNPTAKATKDIEYMVDIVVDVANFKANAGSRFGGEKPFIIWDKKKSNGQLSLIP